MPFSVNLSYKGKTAPLTNITAATTGAELNALAYSALLLSPDECTLKLLFKGKRIDPASTSPVFATQAPAKPPKILVMSSAKISVDELNAKKQDPLMRGFDQEKTTANNNNININNTHWGPLLSKPHKDYKFGRLQECPFHDFGHRPTDTTPHAFAARQVLERLSTDPGVICILTERELYVGTLGEMDPIDDRLMQKKHDDGACLLGYNTNRGLRIDIKLRTDDLTAFRPYPQLVSTLIHELSHNWVGDHNVLFWANYGEMRLEYFMEHKLLKQQSILYKGKTSAELAELDPQILLEQNNMLAFVHDELTKEMAQHGLHPSLIAQPLKTRYDQLQLQSTSSFSTGQKLGGGGSGSGSDVESGGRNLALEAAERRAREQQQEKKKEEQ
jgi:hypothetical protein